MICTRQFFILDTEKKSVLYENKIYCSFYEYEKKYFTKKYLFSILSRVGENDIGAPEIQYNVWSKCLHC